MRRFGAFWTLFALPRIGITGGKEKGCETSEMIREAVSSQMLALFEAPGIISAGKYMGFIGWVFQEFRTSRDVVSQAVIPGHHQSSGATVRRS